MTTAVREGILTPFSTEPITHCVQITGNKTAQGVRIKTEEVLLKRGNSSSEFSVEGHDVNLVNFVETLGLIQRQMAKDRKKLIGLIKYIQFKPLLLSAHTDTPEGRVYCLIGNEGYAIEVLLDSLRKRVSEDLEYHKKCVERLEELTQDTIIKGQKVVWSLDEARDVWATSTDMRAKLGYTGPNRLWLLVDHKPN